MQGKTFIFFGMFGSGKGTQAKLLADLLTSKSGTESIHISPGAEYRRLIEAGTFIGGLVKDSMGRGELQPDFLTNSIINNVLMTSFDDQKNLIMEGYPRRINQSQNIIDFLTFFKREKIVIIDIKITKEEAFKRNLLRGRSDDHEEGFKKRLIEEEENVVPAMNYLKENSACEYHEINGEQSVEDVHKDILKALNL